MSDFWTRLFLAAESKEQLAYTGHKVIHCPNFISPRQEHDFKQHYLSFYTKCFPLVLTFLFLANTPKVIWFDCHYGLWVYARSSGFWIL